MAMGGHPAEEYGPRVPIPPGFECRRFRGRRQLRCLATRSTIQHGAESCETTPDCSRTDTMSCSSVLAQQIDYSTLEEPLGLNRHSNRGSNGDALGCIERRNEN